MAEQQSPVAPVLLTLLLCEKVITDAVSRQVSLIGLVSNVNAPQFPVRSPNLFIFTVCPCRPCRAKTYHKNPSWLGTGIRPAGRA